MSIFQRAFTTTLLVFLLPSFAAAAVLEGDVHADGPAPPAGARVDLLPLVSYLEDTRSFLAGRALPAAVAGAAVEAGRFRLAVPASGLYQVRVAAPGYVPMIHKPLPVIVENGRVVELPPLVLLPDAGLMVDVRDAGGTPAAGVWVTAPALGRMKRGPSPSPGWSPQYRLVRTGKDGRALLPRFGEESLDLYIYTEGNATPVILPGVELDRAVELGPAPPRREVVLRGAGAGVVIAVGDWKWPVAATDGEGRASFAARLTDRRLIFFLREDQPERVAWLEPGELHQVYEIEIHPPITGRLTDRGGRPLAGALVWPHWDPSTFTFTDTRGVYSFVGPQRTRFQIQGEAAGFIPGVIAATPEDAGQGMLPDLVLTASASVSGRVVDAGGRGMAGIHVEARVRERSPGVRRRDPAQARTRTAADGSFVLHGLQADSLHRLSAGLEGFFAAVRDVGGIRPGGERRGLRLVLTANRGAFGRVLDTEEQPLGGVRVTLLPVGEREATPAEAMTDADGRFEVEAMPSMRIELVTHKEGFAPLRVPGVQLVAGAHPHDQGPLGGGSQGGKPSPMDLGTLILAEGAAIEGRVVAADGTALDGAEIWATEDRVGIAREAWEALSARAPDALSRNNRFVVDGLAHGQRVHLVIHREGYLPVALPEVEAPTSEPVLAVLERAALVAGRVLDEGLAPIAGAEITLRAPTFREGISEVPTASQLDPLRFASSGGDGSFEISSLPPGDYLLQVYAPGHMPSAEIPIAITRGSGSRDLEIVLGRGAVLEGRVTTRDGDAIAGVQVSVGRPAATSDADGFFRIAGIPPGPATVLTRHPYFEALLRKIDVEAGTNHLDLELSNAHRLAGRVVDERGAPLADAQLGLENRRGLALPRALSDGEGRFAFPRLAEGTYRLRVSKENYVSLLPWLRIEHSGSDRDDLEIVLVPSARLEGLVLGLDFADLAAVDVVAKSDDGRQRPGRIDYEGRYEITDLAPGDWLVSAVVAGGARQVDARVVLLAGESRAWQDLEFERGLVLSGRVVHGSEPVAAALVALRGANVVAERQVRTDHDGHFRLEALAAGAYHLGVSHHRHKLIHNEDLVLDGDRDLFVELATAELEGRVVTADGAAVHRALVILQQLLADGSESSMFTLGTDAEGRFRFARLPAGPFRLRIRKDGFAQYEEDLEVGPASGLRDFALQPTAGIELRLRLVSGTVPSTASLVLLDDTGRTVLSEGRSLSGGAARFETVPAGSWRAVVSAPGASPREVRLRVPGEALDVVLPDAGRLRVRVPGLFDSPRAATLTLLDDSGRSFEGIDAWGVLRHAWRVTRGTVTVEGVPAGLWTLRLVDADGRLLSSGAVATSGGAEVEVVLD